MGRVIDRQRNEKKLDDGFRRLVLIHILAGLKSEYHHGNDMVAAAEAAVAARIIAACRSACRAGNARIRHVTGVHLRARYEQQEDRDDA